MNFYHFPVFSLNLLYNIERLVSHYIGSLTNGFLWKLHVQGQLVTILTAAETYFNFDLKWRNKSLRTNLYLDGSVFKLDSVYIFLKF